MNSSPQCFMQNAPLYCLKNNLGLHYFCKWTIMMALFRCPGCGESSWSVLKTVCVCLASNYPRFSGSIYFGKSFVSIYFLCLPVVSFILFFDSHGMQLVLCQLLASCMHSVCFLRFQLIIIDNWGSLVQNIYLFLRFVHY